MAPDAVCVTEIANPEGKDRASRFALAREALAAGIQAAADVEICVDREIS
jgi:hypothetical protein